MLKFAREPVIFIAVGNDFFFFFGGGRGNRHLTASEGGSIITILQNLQGDQANFIMT